jgi:hypothetical protein
LRYAPHEFAAASLIKGRQQQVHMVGHQAVRMQPAAHPRDEAAEMEQIKRSVAIGVKACGAVVTPMRDMDGDAGQHDSCSSRHISVNGPPAGSLTENVVRP